MTTFLVAAAMGWFAMPDAAAEVAYQATSTAQDQEQDEAPPQRRPGLGGQQRDRDRSDRPQRDRRDRPGGFRRFTPPAHPLVTALDTDEDGVISAEEIEKAAAALKKLDENEDGKLSAEEISPFAGQGFEGRRGFGGSFQGRGEPDDPAGAGRQRGQRGQGGFGVRGQAEDPAGAGQQRGQRGRGGFGRGQFDGGQFGRGRFGGQGGFGPRGEGPGAAFGFGGANSVESILSRDQNDDGKVTKDEWLAPMERLFDRADANGDGALDQAEAERMAERSRPRGQERDEQGRPGFGGRQRANFAARLMERDANGDGKVTEDEVPEGLRRIFGRLDANSDGAIDKAEAESAAERFGPPGGARRGPRDARPRRRPDAEESPQRPESGEAQSNDDQASARDRRSERRRPDFLTRAGLELGQPLPDVTAYDADGNPFQLAGLKGHYSVLAFGCLT